ncbi:ABC-2 family transporter protein [Leptolyngbya sp. FACHB-261]|uniref:ABC transporter permease n=1 Tax=Leptolyngbya sp. FACHB-261 TaxID=2692806 RepID=UPI0016898355|nr:ABC-2 family transporter protein [Leptolyngbya sp. FACHB-261]MBD2103405.1 ABC-2 family transporter protein [Leptolyngbya sp. FACHB-261]
MRSFWRRARVLSTVYYAYMTEYRAELLLWVLSGVLPFILMGVWMEAAQGGRFGLGPLDFARYFLAAFVARQFSVVWVVWEFEREVVEGRLSPRLLQPMDPAWHHFVSHFAERFARLPFAIILVGFFFVLYPQAIWLPSLSGFLLFCLAVSLAFTMRFIMQYTMAMFAFWTERASAIEEFWFLMYLFLSGLIAPLEIFPQAVRNVIQWTPFPYLINFPASLLVGLPVNVGQGLLVMLAWTGVFFVLNRWLWRQGLKHYSGMGA